MNPGNLIRQLDARLEDLPRAPLLVALSGGIDSSVLLHALASTKSARVRGLRALHVDHGLHRDAGVWAAHCRTFCEGLATALTIERVDVKRDGRGLEAAARKTRQLAFETTLSEGEILVLAHHRDDQAETFLLRALRASGADGLGAMRPWRRFGRGWLWRPLLDRPRCELIAYARTHGVQWIDDPSNADTRLDRNFLRHRVMPLLRERWPHADAAFARSAMLSGEAGELLAIEDEQALAVARGSDSAMLDVERLRTLPAARRARVLRIWIRHLELPPLPAAGLAHIETDLLNPGTGTQAEFAWSGVVVRRWRDVLHAGRQHPPLPLHWRVAWDGREPLPLPDGGTLRLLGDRGFDTPVCVGARQGGERIALTGRAHSHELKHVLQDFGVPPWRRERIPLLSTPDGELLAAGDRICSGRFEVWLRDCGAQLQWLPDDD